MRSVEKGIFETVKGPRLFYRHWKHEGDKLANLLCIHGICCDSRIFDYSGRNLASFGYDVYAIDLPGCGNSEGERGDYPFDDTTRCINEFVQELKQKDEQLFMLGFSLGGLHTLWYASQYPDQIDGLILCAPLLRVKGVKIDRRTQPSLAKFLATYMKYAIIPKAKLDLGEVVPDAFSESASEELRYMKNDKLCNFILSHRYAVNLFLRRASRIEEFSKTHVPTLILHGSDDWLVMPEQSRFLLHKLHSTDKELKILPNCDHWFYHALFYVQNVKYSEAQRKEVLGKVHEWMYKRIQQVKTKGVLS